MRKPAPLSALFVAQFLSAFVDNMILFVILAIIKRDGYPLYYLAFVQSIFLASYIVLSPWVGRLADRHPKAQVLMLGNLLKGGGVLLLLLGCNPALSYALVGVGAVVYSPAKYGILPFLTRNETELLKANAGLESYTILAILAGSVGGGFLADYSIQLALLLCALLYAASVAINTLIPHDAGNGAIGYRRAIQEFGSDTRQLLRDAKGQYSLIGTGSFWLASAVLRMIMFAWAPLTLGITSGTSISLILAVTGVGIAAGALVTPYLVSIRTYRRTLWYGAAMGLSIVGFMFIHNLPLTVVALLAVGMLGGIYIVPMNACLQQVGHESIGAGKTIAVQNFVENTFMFIGVSLYTLAAKSGVPTLVSLGVTGGVFLTLVVYLAWLVRRKV